MIKIIDDKISIYDVLNRLDDLILKLNPEEGGGLIQLKLTKDYANLE